ncbi:MAG TPA: ABC transporter permease, partial [Solibacillus sp.]
MRVVWKLSKYVKPYILFAIIAPVMMLIEVGMDLLQPTILQHIIDDGIAKSDTAYIVKMFGLMLVTSLIGLIGGVGCSIYASRTAVNFSTDLRQDLYETITYFSNKSKDQFTLGKLVTNLTSDIEMLQRALTMLLKIFVRGPMMFIGAIVIVFITARELFPILLVVVPILAFFMYYFTALSGKLFYKVQKVVDQVNTKVQENLAGIRVIKAYNRKGHQIEQFTDVNTELMKRSM